MVKRVEHGDEVDAWRWIERFEVAGLEFDVVQPEPRGMRPRLLDRDLTVIDADKADGRAAARHLAGNFARTTAQIAHHRHIVEPLLRQVAEAPNREVTWIRREKGS